MNNKIAKPIQRCAEAALALDTTRTALFETNRLSRFAENLSAHFNPNGTLPAHKPRKRTIIRGIYVATQP